MAIIRFVEKKSPFRKKALPGDELVAVNGSPVRDFLDYTYQTALGVTEISVLRKGKRLDLTLSEPTEDPGLEFDNYLMDCQRSCKNKCVFCFIDQLPKGMRDTMYYKDDDFRLSLLYGNYVTMTNMTEEDMDRIIRMKISPFNVSVHTTDPDLRVRMMKNPAAANVFERMQRLRDAEINMRAQIVLCPDWNDGDALTRTLDDLLTLSPMLSGVSVVPVGLTRFREGLEPLRLYTPEECAAVVAQVEAYAETCLKEHETRFVWCADEFYLKAGLDVPDYEYYEEFEQLENGVGMIAIFRRELSDLLSFMEKPFTRPIRVSSVTGLAAEDLMRSSVETMKDRFPNLECNVYGIRNDFFGPDVTVTGLVTGTDIINQLKGKDLGDYLLIPSVMLRDQTFLDDVTVRTLQKELHVKIRVCEDGAEGFAEALMRCARR